MRELVIESGGLDTAIDVTHQIARALAEMDAAPGLAAVYAHGSSIGLVLMRYEPGTVRDLLAALEEVAPLTMKYAHELTTGDPNGAAHIRSSLLGSSLLVPWDGTALAVSPSHRIVLLDFDLKPASRRLIVDGRRPERRESTSA